MMTIGIAAVTTNVIIGGNTNIASNLEDFDIYFSDIFSPDTDSVKNCFKLEAGDDLMTATVRNCNPNGTDYIWYLSDSIKEDMSYGLQRKIEAYNSLFDGTAPKDIQEDFDLFKVGDETPLTTLPGRLMGYSSDKKYIKYLGGYHE